MNDYLCFILALYSSSNMSLVFMIMDTLSVEHAEWDSVNNSPLTNGTSVVGCTWMSDT